MVRGWGLFVWVWVGFVGSGFWVGFVGFVVRRCLAGFWVLQSVWLGLGWIGAVPAGPGPPPWLREAVLRPKAARLAFVVVVLRRFVCSWVWVWVVCLFVVLHQIEKRKRSSKGPPA